MPGDLVRVFHYSAGLAAFQIGDGGPVHHPQEREVSAYEVVVPCS